jgi:hypothetical protein
MGGPYRDRYDQEIKLLVASSMPPPYLWRNSLTLLIHPSIAAHNSSARPAAHALRSPWRRGLGETTVQDLRLLRLGGQRPPLLQL